MSLQKFNLSLDDFSPHEKSGLYFESINWCDKLIEKYPNIKINLFVPASYCRLGEKPCNLSDNPEWVDKVRSLPEKNYRINLHGLFHRRSKKDFVWHRGIESNNNEWENLTYAQAANMLSDIDIEFKKSGLAYEKTIRPPGWHIGIEASRLLTDSGFVIAGSKEYLKKMKNINGIRWVSYNYDLLGEVPTGNIIAYGHTNSLTNNYFDKSKYDLLCGILSNGFRFIFLEEAC